MGTPEKPVGPLPDGSLPVALGAQRPPPEAPPPAALAVSEAVAVPDPAGPPSPVYPARFEISYPSELNRWLHLITWVLVIPHFIALLFAA